MTFQLDASHFQHEREAEAARRRLVRLARAGRPAGSVLDRVRAAVGLGIVEFGLALAGDGARRRAREGAGRRSVAL